MIKHPTSTKNATKKQLEVKTKTFKRNTQRPYRNNFGNGSPTITAPSCLFLCTLFLCKIYSRHAVSTEYARKHESPLIPRTSATERRARPGNNISFTVGDDAQVGAQSTRNPDLETPARRTPQVPRHDHHFPSGVILR